MIMTSLRKFPNDWQVDYNYSKTLAHPKSRFRVRRTCFTHATIDTPGSNTMASGHIEYRWFKGFRLSMLIWWIYSGIEIAIEDNRRNALAEDAIQQFEPWSTKDGKFVEEL